MRLLVFALVGTLAMARPRVPSKSHEIYVPEYEEEKLQESPSYDYESPASPPQYDQASRAEPYNKQAPGVPPTFVPILKDLRQSPEQGVYNMAIETGNGIKVLQQVAGNHEGSRTKGAYYFTHPDGTVHKVTYIADENGFRPSSDLLPVAPTNPHPIPAHALAQIEKARLEDERRKAQGGNGEHEGRQTEYEQYEAYEQYEEPLEDEYDGPYEAQESNRHYELQDDIVYDEDPEHQYALEGSENFPVHYDPQDDIVYEEGQENQYALEGSENYPVHYDPQEDFVYAEGPEHEYAREGSENIPLHYDPQPNSQEPRDTLFYPVQEDSSPYQNEAISVLPPSLPYEEQEVIHINDVPVYIPEEYRKTSEEAQLSGHTVTEEDQLAPTPAQEEPAPTLEGVSDEGLQPREDLQGISIEVSEPEAAIDDVVDSELVKSDFVYQSEPQPEPSSEPEPKSEPEPEPEPEPAAEERSIDVEEEEGGYDVPNEAASALMAAVNAAQPHDE